MAFRKKRGFKKKAFGKKRLRNVKMKKIGTFRSRKAMAVLRNLSKKRRIVKLGKPIKRGKRVLWPISADGRYK
jgi:hypothetical protein